MTQRNRWMDISVFCNEYNLNPVTVAKYCRDGKIKAEIMGPNNSWHIDSWQWEVILKNNDLDPEEAKKRRIVHTILKTDAHLKQYVGASFGILTVVECFRNHRQHSIAYAKCKCECGGYRTVQVIPLLEGNYVSCGCQDFFIKAIMRTYREGAISRGHVFELDKKLFSELIRSQCFYCNSKPKERIKIRRGNEFRMNANGIDRKDNNLGYVESNVVACCWDCNRAKSDLEVSEFFQWASRLFAHQKAIGNDLENYPTPNTVADDV